MCGRYIESAILAVLIKEIAGQIYSYSNLLISTGRFFYHQAQASMHLPPDNPFEIKQGLLEKLSACFICSQPGQLLLPYLQVAD